MCEKRGRSEGSRNRQHVVIFPFPAKGHTIPLLHFSTALSLRGLKVTLIATKGTFPFLEEYLHLPNPNIHVVLLPFPSIPTIPPGCESTDDLPSLDLYIDFYHATMLLDGAFREALQNMEDSGDLPLCVISDFFLWWTRPISEEEFDVPRLSFSGMGVFSTSILMSLDKSKPFGDVANAFHVPGTPDRVHVKLRDFPSAIRHFDPQNPMLEIVKPSEEEEFKSSGTVVNSFAYMESEYEALLETCLRKGARPWLLGPLSLYPCGLVSAENSSVLSAWLDGKPRDSVLYVAFGTQAEVPHVQLDEIARGLMMSGWDFIWVVRSHKWTPEEEVSKWLEEARVEKKGLLLREMAPQRAVLEHSATGGFVSHCGWNSILESVVAEVPILAWPMTGHSEQGLNAKYVVDEMGVAVRMHDGDMGELVSGEEVCAGVKELMEREGGRKAREKVKLLAEAAMAAVREGGSSSETLDVLLEELRNGVPETFPGKTMVNGTHV